MINYSEISGLHIFKGGTPETKKFTEAELDHLVDNFIKLKESGDAKLTPIAKISHKGNQAEIAANLGVFGFGFANKIWRKGSDLYANLVNVPDKVVDALNTGELLPQPSVEIYKDFTDGKGIKHGPAIGAIAFLTGEQPRVKGLKGFVDAHSEELTVDNVHCYNEQQSTETYKLGVEPMKQKIETHAELEQAMVKDDAMEELRDLHWAFVDKIYDITWDNDLSDEEKKARLISIKDEYHTLLDKKMAGLIEAYSEDERFSDEATQSFKAKFQGHYDKVMQGIGAKPMKKKETPVGGKQEDFAEMDQLRKDNATYKKAETNQKISDFKTKIGQIFSSKIADKAVELFSAIADDKEVVLFSEAKSEANMVEAFSELIDDMAKAKKDNCLTIDFSDTEDTSGEPVDSFGEDPNNEKLAEAAEKYSEEHDVSYREALDIVGAKKKEKE